MSPLMIKRGRRYCHADKVEILNAAAALQVCDLAREPVSNPSAARAYLRQVLAPRESECFAALWLDGRHRVLAFDVLFNGTVNAAAVYPREVVKACLRHNAAAVIISHNHPSGVLEPSAADEIITRRLKEALALIDVRIVDHVIVSSEGCYSFAEKGLI